VKCECPASGNVGGKGLWNVLFEPAGTYTNAPMPEQLNTPRFDTMRARWDYYLKTVFASTPATAAADAATTVAAGGFTEASVAYYWDVQSSTGCVYTGTVGIQKMFTQIYTYKTDASVGGWRKGFPLFQTQTNSIFCTATLPNSNTLVSSGVDETYTYMFDSADNNFGIMRMNGYATGYGMSCVGAGTRMLSSRRSMDLFSSNLQAPPDNRRAGISSAAQRWQHHYEAFSSKSTQMILEDYTEESIINAYDDATGQKCVFQGLKQIGGYFDQIWLTLTDLSTMGTIGSTPSITESPRAQIFLIAAVPGVGVTHEVDSFILDPNDNYKILQQNTLAVGYNKVSCHSW